MIFQQNRLDAFVYLSEIYWYTIWCTYDPMCDTSLVCSDTHHTRDLCVKVIAFKWNGEIWAFVCLRNRLAAVFGILKTAHLWMFSIITCAKRKTNLQLQQRTYFIDDDRHSRMWNKSIKKLNNKTAKCCWNVHLMFVDCVLHDSF